MSWADIENAMQEAVVRASGFPSERVFWSYQNRNAPPQDYILVHFGGPIAIGLDWVRQDQNLTRPNGQEIRQVVSGVRECAFDVTVFTADTLGDAAARQVAETVRSRFRLSSVRYGMRKAGVSPFDSGPVEYVPDIPSADFRGRAVVSIRCYVPLLDCVEYVGYIARVRGVAYPTGLVGYTGQATGFPFDSLQASGSTGFGQ